MQTSDPDKAPLFAFRAFRLIFWSRVSVNVALQMQAVAVGWQIYDLTGSPLALGLIGLVQFLPPLGLTLPAGQIADRYDRRFILRICYCIELTAMVGLVLLTLFVAEPVTGIYGVLLLSGVARAFESPAVQAILPTMVPREIFGRAVAATSSASKFATILGPALGGFIYALGPEWVYGVGCLLLCSTVVSFLLLERLPMPERRAALGWHSMMEGLGFIRRRQPVLGAISLDLAAVLFGGATALLPIFARDILDLGPTGLGILRASPAAGALLVAIYLSRRPIARAGGRLMFISVAVFGFATILFGLSHDFLLSVLALMLIGVSDQVSVVIRMTLVQSQTPEELRGRVAAVNSLFIGTSNQLGAFESGVTADWFGAVGSVLLGGGVTLLSTVLWAWWFPSLRRVGRPDEAAPAEAEA
jgi:MFS family permease